MANSAWWRHAVIYQIYPRSFKDSNGDGIGDLHGIVSKLDYLHWLGVEAVWLSPVYPSPMADFGYDVSDYTGIAPMFGTLDDFDALVAQAHRRDIRVILDYVPNHSSDRHPWFLAARASRNDPKRDWYIWRDAAADGGPPNNWLGSFGGGSAWEWDERTRQYYYHAYLREQPDLNWRNPEVQAAMFEVLRFWLRRGVDGFRVDAVWHLIKDAQFRDDPPNPSFRPGVSPYDRNVPRHSADQPEVHAIVASMRRVLAEFGGNRLLIGEAYLPLARLAAYYGTDLGGFHFPFNFQLLAAPWRAEYLSELIADYERSLPAGAWPNWVLGNHDRHRIASRIGIAQAPVAAMLLLTLRGTPVIYYGDEIGMEDVPVPPERVQDPWEKNVPGLGLGRDPERSPMQWDDSPHAGFSSGIPWLPVATDYATRNVQMQRDDPSSLLTLHRRLIALRRREPALTRGAHIPVAASGDVLVYTRSHQQRRLVIALNLGSEPEAVSIDSPELHGRILLSTLPDRDGEDVHGTIALHGNEGVIVAAE